MPATQKHEEYVIVSISEEGRKFYYASDEQSYDQYWTGTISQARCFDTGEKAKTAMNSQGFLRTNGTIKVARVETVICEF